MRKLRTNTEARGSGDPSSRLIPTLLWKKKLSNILPIFKIIYTNQHTLVGVEEFWKSSLFAMVDTWTYLMIFYIASIRFWNLFLSQQGMHYLHGTDIRSHGALKSSNCVVDSRFVLKITDFGLHALRTSEKDTRAHSYWTRKLIIHSIVSYLPALVFWNVT